MKGNSGITLMALTITIIVLFIITTITLYNVQEQVSLKNLNNLYTDIETLNSKVSAYYLKNNSLPVFEKKYLTSSTTLQNMISSKDGETVDETDLINTNDGNDYYVLDLSKLDNLTLMYGKNYKEWESDALANYTIEKYKDLYIINGVTHQVYYPRGIKYQKKYYYFRHADETSINAISVSAITDEWSAIVNNSEVIQANENEMIINANITVSINNNFDKDSLEYAWSPFNNQNDAPNIEFTKFSLDDLNSATISSKLINNTIQEYYLWIKVLDNNMEEKYKIFKITV